jgi:hypothetical protein
MLTLTLYLGLVGTRESLDQPFDFTKFPNLKEVDLTAPWVAGGLRWIPASLSTFRPATSPNLSVIRLKFNYGTRLYPSREFLEQMSDDLLLTKDEIARIRREFAVGAEIVICRGI